MSEQLMNRRQFRSRQSIKILSRCLLPSVAACMWMIYAGGASAQLAPNQTNGFGNGHLVTFTYLQNFDCVDEPSLDLDFNGIPAASDPEEMQTPICQVVTEPSADPTGGDLKHTAHLYVFVPMFGTSTTARDAMDCPPPGPRPDELCGANLGAELIRLFGHIPEAWMAKPTLATLLAIVLDFGTSPVLTRAVALDSDAIAEHWGAATTLKLVLLGLVGPVY